ncbi:MAG: glucokinase [Burkholderiales bacterium]|nr:glucokinase [Burkholderiales bacterium]
MTTYPRLIADIGGTNARFSIEVSPYTYELTQVLDCEKYETLALAILAYLKSIKMVDKIHHAALALPTPIVGDILHMVNSPWHRQLISQTKKDVGMDNILFLNDFHALALSIPHINKNNLKRVGGTDEPDSIKPMAIIGPGTGLGMATLLKHPLGEYLAIPAEGGRSSFSPVNEEEIELWKFAHRRFHHVSVERFVCGPGLQLIYEGLCNIDHRAIDILPTPSEITERGTNGMDFTCQRTLEVFCRMLGTIASNLAVIVNSFGGVYIGGGIIPKILPYFMNSDFRGRFEAKGRYHAYLAKMPVYVIVDQFSAFLGASYALNTYLTRGYIP